MILPKGLEREFWQELKVYEEERRMPYITSVEQIGFERGIEQGIERGIEQGIERGIEQGVQREARSLILRLLNRRLQELPDRFQLQIDALSIAQLEALGEALLDFGEIADLDIWLRDNQ